MALLATLAIADSPRRSSEPVWIIMAKGSGATLCEGSLSLVTTDPVRSCDNVPVQMTMRLLPPILHPVCLSHGIYARPTLRHFCASKLPCSCHCRDCLGLIPTREEATNRAASIIVPRYSGYDFALSHVYWTESSSWKSSKANILKSTA